MFKLATRNIRQHKVRTLLTILGITLSSALILAMGILSHSILTFYQGKLTEVTGKADILMFSTNQNHPIQTKTVSELEKQPGVAGVTPTLSLQAKWEVGDERETIALLGVDPARDPHFKDYTFWQGNWFDTSMSGSIILNRSAAEDHGLSVGQAIQIILPDGNKQERRIVGILEEVGAGNTSEQVLGLMPLQDLQRALQTDRISTLEIYNQPATDSGTLIRDLKVAFPEAKFSDLMQVKENVFERSGYQSIDKAFIVVGAIVFLVSSLLVYNTFSVILVERIEQIGILKTLGQDRGNTIAMFMAEGSVLGIIGTAFGQGLGILLGKGILRWQFQLDMKTFYHFSWTYCLVSIVSGLLMPLISALIPALRASRLSPIGALKFRDSARTVTRPKDSLYTALWLFLIAAVPYFYANRLVNKELMLLGYIILMYCMVVGAVFALPSALEMIASSMQAPISRLFGVEGKMALRTMLRNKQRSAILISMIGIGVFMVIGFHGLFYSLTTAINASVAEQMRFDLEIRGEEIDDHEAKESRLERTVNVDKVLRSGSFSQESDGVPAGSFKITALDYATYSQLFSFDLLEGTARELETAWDRGRYLVVTQEVAEALDTSFGSTVMLQSQSGKLPFKVLGVIEAGGYGAYISWNSYTQALGYDRITSLYLQLEDPALAEDTVAAVNQQLKDEAGLTLLRQDKRKGQTLDVVGNLSELINKMNLVVLLVSVLCLMNTMIMSILERYKEIGMMRSLGATRSQVRRMILIEGMLFALLGGALGIAQGLFFSGKMVEATKRFIRFDVPNLLDFRYMFQILIAVLIMAFLASLYPAQQAAQQGIVEAIKGE